ncbi:DUF4833 domain-containing protein [Sphingobacterium sp. SGG-5]|uniref:DUF4833 domain-containing protein n=1 Tax=Sphingobacterium sp. SGG-5 TaxID=2710881 RepID=UPI0013ECB067|nr:DUF4833 domain-containing protein [Sphingobacterium sp. SGG-5]NGM62458.1 DUF4833 domain-containing protein [Sphingobacterium sp. SGG-5]
MRALLFIAPVLFFTKMVYGQQGYPAPTHSKNLLFYIQHDRGQNTFVYKANLTKSKSFVTNNPVIVSRQLFDEKGEIKPLTKIQKLFAYGIKSAEVAPDNYQSHIVSLPDQKITISLDSNKTPIAETCVNGTKIILERIFIKQTEGTSGLGTKLDYIIFYGRNKKGISTKEILRL